MVRGFGGNRSGSGKNHGHAYGALDEAQTMSQPDPERLKLARKRFLAKERKFKTKQGEKLRQQFEDGLERALREALGDEP